MLQSYRSLQVKGTFFSGTAIYKTPFGLSLKKFSIATIDLTVLNHVIIITKSTESSDIDDKVSPSSKISGSTRYTRMVLDTASSIPLQASDLHNEH